MRSLLTKVLVLLGAFLLTIALLAALWVPSQVKKTPLDVNSVTRLAGTAEVADGAGGTKSSPVKATSTTHADSALSTKDIVLFQNSSCLLMDPDGDAPDCVSADDPDGRLLAAGTDVFATDRKTALAVNDFANLPADAQPKEGLMNKFPFGVKQETYPFWDGYVQKAVDAVFDGTEDIDGLKTYRFKIQVPATAIEVSSGISGTYTTEKSMWIEPQTGSIIKQEEHQVRKLSNGDTFLDLNFGFTPETVAANVEAGKDNANRLSLLTSKVPLIAGVLGLLALVVGLFLALGRKPVDETYATEGELSAAEDGTYADGYQDSTEQFFDEAEGETRASRREGQE